MGGEGWRQKVEIRWVRTRAWAGRKLHRSVHARRAKAGTFLDLAGEKRAKVGRCFRFPSSFFELQSSGALAAVDRWEESACEMGMGLRFGPWDAGAASTAWRGENTARNAVVKRCALSRCSSFVFMLSLDSGEKALVFFFGLWEFVRFAADFRF